QQDALGHLKSMATMAEGSDVRYMVVDDALYKHIFTDEKTRRKPDMTAANWLKEYYARYPKGAPKNDQVHILEPKEWLALINNANLLDKLIELTQSSQDPLITLALQYREHPDQFRMPLFRAVRSRVFQDLAGAMKVRQDAHGPDPGGSPIV